MLYCAGFFRFRYFYHSLLKAALFAIANFNGCVVICAIINPPVLYQLHWAAAANFTRHSPLIVKRGKIMLNQVVPNAETLYIAVLF